MAKSIRIATIAVLLAVGWVYYGSGIHFVVWNDSSDYLSQGLSIGSPTGYERTIRSIGYPLMLALPARMEFAALAIAIIQGALAVLAYRVLYRHLVAAAPAVAPRRAGARAVFLAVLPLALALTSGYSVLQVFIVSLLPEVLFAALTLLSVVAVSRFVINPDQGTATWRRAALAAAAATAPLLVRPHWMLAAPVLVVIVAARLAFLSWRAPFARFARLAASAAAALMPVAILAVIMAPERHLSANINPEASLFGPRALFCNHLHMIDDTLARHRDLRLHPDPEIDGHVRHAMHELRKRDQKPWVHLGFNGDLCNFDQSFHQLMSQLLPAVEARRQFYIGSFLVAARAEPLRFARKIARQIVLGLERSFDKFAYHVSTPLRDGLPAHFLAGTTGEGEAGPLGAKWRLKSTPSGWLVMACLGAIFLPLLIAYLALFAVSLLGAPLRWQHWSGARRQAFLAYVGVPMTAVLAHHMLVGTVHTFDIWRYTFGVFFVNLAFVGAAGLFWYEDVSDMRMAADANRASAPD